MYRHRNPTCKQITFFLKRKNSFLILGVKVKVEILRRSFQIHAAYTHSSSVRMFWARAEAGAGARCRARTLMHGLLMLVMLPVVAAG